MPGLTVNFIIEDGTQIVGSNSYVSLAEFRQYWFDRGVDYQTALTDDQIKSYLIKATRYIDAHFHFTGGITWFTQSLQWPRFDMFDSKGYRVLNNVIPKELKCAVHEFAGAYARGINFDPEITEGVAAKSMAHVSVSFRTGNPRIRIYEAERWLAPFLSIQPLVARV